MKKGYIILIVVLIVGYVAGVKYPQWGAKFGL
jgi:hypothetical protein